MATRSSRTPGSLPPVPPVSSPTRVPPQLPCIDPSRTGAAAFHLDRDQHCMSQTVSSTASCLRRSLCPACQALIRSPSAKEKLTAAATGRHVSFQCCTAKLRGNQLHNRAMPRASSASQSDTRVSAILSVGEPDFFELRLLDDTHPQVPGDLCASFIYSACWFSLAVQRADAPAPSRSLCLPHRNEIGTSTPTWTGGLNRVGVQGRAATARKTRPA
jgi:hypothetical protein